MIKISWLSRTMRDRFAAAACEKKNVEDESRNQTRHQKKHQKMKRKKTKKKYDVDRYKLGGDSEAQIV